MNYSNVVCKILCSMRYVFYKQKIFSKKFYVPKNLNAKEYEFIKEKISELNLIMLIAENEYGFDVNFVISKNIIKLCLNELELLLKNQKTEQAHDLIDAIHGLPEALENPKRDLKSFYEVYFKSYQKKWKSTIFEEFKKDFL